MQPSQLYPPLPAMDTSQTSPPASNSSQTHLSPHNPFSGEPEQSGLSHSTPLPSMLTPTGSDKSQVSAQPV
ncbi:hypothetical protein LDENG_00009390, partial [Lucifuga dentata]